MFLTCFVGLDPAAVVAMAHDDSWRADWGAPPWHVDVDIPPHPPPASCDVAVIGAGFTGLSTAYHLARRGCRVAVLEAARVGDGASGRTGGLALEGTASGPRPGAERCLDVLARLTTEAGIACDLDLRGCWELAHAPPPSPSPARGEGMRMRGRQSWRDGDTWLHVASTVAGGTVDPGALVSGLARAALAAGATIHERTRVERIESGAGVMLHAGGGVLRAAHAVAALNGYTAELVALPAVRAPLTLALCTAPVDDATLAALGLAERTPFYTLDLPYLWGRHVPGGRLIFGAGLVFPGDGVVRHVDVRAAESAAVFARLEARVRGLHPALADVEVTHRWGGPIAFRSTAAPMLGPAPGLPRVLVTGAYAGHGVALSVVVGQLVAAAIVDGAPLPRWGVIEEEGEPARTD